ncbi:MAG: methyltransferase domain-containing protein [Stellaceae bacterium]
MNDRYIGTELEIFAAASNWKSYIAQKIGPFIDGRVLEVGAGIGANTRVLYSARVSEWTCLEPDPDLAGRIKWPRKHGGLPRCCRVVNGTVAALESSGPFDTILYLDVLEHIANDRAELACAARLLSPQGHPSCSARRTSFCSADLTQLSAITDVIIGRCCEL